MAMVLEKRDLQSATLICILAMVLGLGIYGLMSAAVERQLKIDAQETSQQWADYFSKSLSDLEKIAAGTKPSEDSLRHMKQAERIGNVFRYKIFDAQGYLRFISDRSDLIWPEKPSLAKHNVEAARAIESGKPYTQINHGQPPNRPMMYAETYLPIIKNGKLVAVVEVYVDQSPLHSTFRNNFLLAIVATLGLTMVAFGVPAAAFYYRTRQKEAADRELTKQNRILSTVLKNTSQGLCLFDSEQRLLTCNDQYTRIYGMSPESASAGMTLQEILERRIDEGFYAGEDPQDYIDERTKCAAENIHKHDVHLLSDGRTISVYHKPLPDGGWLTTHEDITELHRIESEAKYLAQYDQVTELPNRNLFHEQLEEAANLREEQNFAVLCIDLDNFKSVNDSLGHRVGDRLLRTVAKRFSACLSDTDTLSRLGNDEFAIMRNSALQPEDATALAESLCRAAEEPFQIDGHQIITNVSIGIAVYPVDGASPDELLRNADIALSRARSDGRGKYRFFETTMDTHIKEQRQLELDLRTALNNGEFELYYQPVVEAQSDEVCGFEALLRWHHPERGLVAPDEFIPEAEASGLIIQMGEWVIREACKTAATWPEHVKVAVNLSTIQFKSDNLVPTVMNALSTSGISPGRLELEITESIFLDDEESTLTTLLMLRNLGIRIAMDDFGTGYSSLSYLRSFPFDKLKLDRCFIKDLGGNNDAQSIIRAVASLGTSLGMTVTAEGVETEDQLEKVKAEGYTEIQGYFYSQPRPASEMTDRYFPAKKNGDMSSVA